MKMMGLVRELFQIPWLWIYSKLPQVFGDLNSMKPIIYEKIMTDGTGFGPEGAEL